MGEKNSAPASRYFRAVVQTSSEQQMSVARWLMEDPLYETIWILHDKDVCSDDALDTNDDECFHEETFENSDRIKPHYHFIIRAPKKIAAQTMTKRFGGYVHFQLCGDPFDYAYYITHETFRARKKHRYSESEICGDMDFMRELRSKTGKDIDLCRSWQQYLDDAHGCIEQACTLAIRDGNGQLIKQLKSHAYFYEHFFRASLPEK